MSGHLGDLSPTQEAALRSFREAVGDVLKPEHDDRYLLRWLRARDFNLNKAEQMLRAHVEWRKQFGTDDVRKWPESPEVLRKYYPGGFVGHDHEGRPVSIITLGSCDLKGLLNSVSVDEVMRHVVWQFENAEEDIKQQSEKLGKAIETITYIFDFDGFALSTLASKAVIDYLTNLMCIFEDNYPERLHKAFAINAPRYFPIFWKIIRPFLSEQTAQKLVLFGKDEQAWKKALLDDIDADQLPRHWGGTQTDPDGNPRCPSVVIDGGVVPTRYYRNANGNSPSELQECSDQIPAEVARANTAVSRQATLDVPVRVDEAGMLLAWEIVCDDLLFGISYKGTGALPAENNSAEIILKPSRIKAIAKVPETGSVTCSKAGLYVLHFDNSFSTFTSKKVSYSVRLLEASAMRSES
ncbi:SEC14-like protein 2 [Dermacentor andersoni]|uniref:SEC14-like protein 2 n=1 Tax=Dermacentor andersoni TaxID=34620 RepID=UPI002155CC29|nr:SEC14-like protein 2 [Dermacentor andersoni]